MKKFDNFISNLEILQKAENEDLKNEFIISGIIDKFFIQFELSWKNCSDMKGKVQLIPDRREKY